jgi:hypothetical protein
MHTTTSCCQFDRIISFSDIPEIACHRRRTVPVSQFNCVLKRGKIKSRNMYIDPHEPCCKGFQLLIIIRYYYSSGKVLTIGSHLGKITLFYLLIHLGMCINARDGITLTALNPSDVRTTLGMLELAEKSAGVLRSGWLKPSQLHNPTRIRINSTVHFRLLASSFPEHSQPLYPFHSLLRVHCPNCRLVSWRSETPIFNLST